MLREYYNLSLQPFGVTPDPTFLYLSPTHGEAMATLLHGIRSQTGFTALIATPGMGKTTLLFSLLHILKSRNTRTAFLFQPLHRPNEFLHALLTDLGIADDGENMARMHAKLNEYLLRESQDGRQVVVVIDEAQNLNEDIFEAVRTLSNFETSSRKLLHVVLAGQPQLAAKLSSDSLIQLRQRISMVARLAPLNAQETRDYIEHRLKVAGYSSEAPLFSDSAFAMIAEQSQGIPRNINNLCFNSMTLGCALKRTTVDESMVQESINDLDLGTIASPAKQSADTSLPPLQLSDGTPPASNNWRIPALLAIAFLVSVAWLFSPFVGKTTAIKQSAMAPPANSSQASISQTESAPLAAAPEVSLTLPKRAKQKSRSSDTRNTIKSALPANDILEIQSLLSADEPRAATQLVRIPLSDPVEATNPSPLEVTAAPLEQTKRRGTP
jgi:general secretion pathway protein A